MLMILKGLRQYGGDTATIEHIPRELAVISSYIGRTMKMFTPTSHLPLTRCIVLTSNFLHFVDIKLDHSRGNFASIRL